MQTEINLKFTSSVVTDRGLSEKRPQNEDSYLELSEHGVFAVADGVGGAQAGDVASQMAVEILAEAFNNQSVNTDAEDVMRLAIERANSAIYQMATDLPQLASMATTIVALQISGNIATFGHVGDSRLYRIDPRGKLHRETADHSVVEEEVRAGRMTSEQALNHPSRNVISRALGAEGNVDVDLKTMMFEPGTMFLLCSDGVTRHIPDRELEELFISDIEPRILTQRIKKICYTRGAEDNLTAVVVRISSELGEELAGIRNYKPVLSVEESNFEYVDEDTIATARPQAETFSGFTDDRSTGNNDSSNSARPENLDDESYLSDELSNAHDAENTKDHSNYASSSVVVPAPAVAPIATVEKIEKTRLPEMAQTGSISKFFAAFIFLVIGSVIGATVYHLLKPEPPEPVIAPPILVEKSPDVSVNGFEEGRRLVDRDPAAYLTANAASPQSSEDYFLMGRAFLLTGKQWEAKRAFGEARDRLAQADPKNAKTLTSEIAMALAIIESPGASQSFTREIAAGSGSATNANANTAIENVNTSNRQR